MFMLYGVLYWSSSEITIPAQLMLYINNSFVVISWLKFMISIVLELNYNKWINAFYSPTLTGLGIIVLDRGQNYALDF